MAKVTNTFIKSKLNKDLDARLVPNGEYRDAVNVQVSRSEGDSVGSLENVLGNIEIKDFGNSDLTCIGYFADEASGMVYVFLTDYTDASPNTQRSYSTTAENYIYSYNTTNNTSVLLVQGSFLNFSKTNPIFGINLLEEFLFWTDNRNQPRKININRANPNGIATPDYYTNEDQVSAAKYNPYKPIELYREASSTVIETTMEDATSKFLPNGGSVLLNADIAAQATSLPIQGGSVKGQVLTANPVNPYTNNVGATVSYVDINNNIQTISGVTVNTFPSGISITLTGTTANVPALTVGTEIIFNANPKYNSLFTGDSDYLNDLFVRFSYRFKFDDGEYSLIAPFTQVAFIPKQDGYFMYIKPDATTSTAGLDDQANSYRSSIVSFVENKVNIIKLIIPRPSELKTGGGFAGSTLDNEFKISEVDILFKESDALSVKVVDTIPVGNVTINNEGDIEYLYESTKPFKTLPSDELIRVYDKVPVRALGQEVSGNRVIYANFQNKHTPPAVLDYTIAINAKDNVALDKGTAVIPGSTSGTTLNFSSSSGTIDVGSYIYGTGIVKGTVVTSVTGSPVSSVTISAAATNAVGTVTFRSAGDEEVKVSKVEYPNSSVKQNRNYQVGVVLSDRYGRQSTVILNDINQGSTIYHPYFGKGLEQNEWPGDSIKMLFNSPVGPTAADQTNEWPGLYNGDVASANYNPLGWYSYKIVVKQTEQEYYNVYLPGIMAAYPDSTTLEIGNTSHTVLIADNINKIPRDLSEVGPEQRQFRSSVRLYGRVENTAVTISTANFGLSNKQYYPSTQGDNASIISTMRDLFEVPTTLTAGFKQFYDHESDPLIARISTESKIGQISSVNSGTVPPGIQYLAVYETEPVESLIDIFWETTSAGLISSLNDAILTGTGGGASLSSFNTSNWSEALASGGDILNAGFNLLNQTGQVITISGNNSFDLISVIDGTGQDVQNLPSAGPYFQMYLDSGFYKIRTTSTYYSQVYFGTNPQLREFTFNFRSIIIDANNVSTTTLFSEFATVNNVSPTITASPASGTTINTNRDNLNTLVALSAVNGANNTNLAGKDLTWNIISQKVTGDTTNTQVNYFELTTPVVGNTSATNLKNISSATEAKSYDIIIGCSDPGSTPQVNYVINVSFTPTFVRDYNINYNLTSGGRIAVNFVVIYAQNGINTNQVGYYLIASSNPVSSGNALTFNSQIVPYQTNLTLINISGGGTASSPITLNKTGADLAVNGTCNVQDGFITYFNTNLNTLLTDNVNTFVRNCLPDGSIQNTTFSNELTSTDLQQYVFEII